MMAPDRQSEFEELPSEWQRIEAARKQLDGFTSFRGKRNIIRPRNFLEPDRFDSVKRSCAASVPSPSDACKQPFSRFVESNSRAFCAENLLLPSPTRRPARHLAGASQPLPEIGL